MTWDPNVAWTALVVVTRHPIGTGMRSLNVLTMYPHIVSSSPDVVTRIPNPIRTSRRRDFFHNCVWGSDFNDDLANCGWLERQTAC